MKKFIRTFGDFYESLYSARCEHASDVFLDILASLSSYPKSFSVKPLD